MSSKVIGGTPKDINLCDSCSNFQLTRFQGGSEIRLCHVTMGEPLRIPDSVSECSRHHDKGYEALYELEGKAWVLEVKKGRTIGFKKVNEWHRDHPGESLV